MRNRRRNWLLRRLVLGLAVAAVVAPTAQARVDEGGSAKSDDGNGAVIQGDDKVIVESDGRLLVIRGDDKVFAPAPEGDGILVSGDDKVFAPAPEGDGILVSGDDKVFAPVPGSDLVVLVKGDDKVFAPVPGSDLVVLVKGDDKVMPTAHGPIQATSFRPAGRQVPVVATGNGTDFNWPDALIGAMVALGLALLLYAAARSTRGIRRPAAN